MDSGVEISVVGDSVVPEVQTDGVARGLEAFTVLEHSETQLLFLQNLFEVYTFQ